MLLDRSYRFLLHSQADWDIYIYMTSKDINPGGDDDRSKVDLESQQTTPTQLAIDEPPPNPRRRRWRRIVLILQASQIFITVAAAKNGSLTGVSFLIN